MSLKMSTQQSIKYRQNSNEAHMETDLTNLSLPRSVHVIFYEMHEKKDKF